MNNLCAVFVCDIPYFNKFIDTCSQLITNGKYSGDICLVVGDDLKDNILLDCDFIKTNNIYQLTFISAVAGAKFLITIIDEL